MRIKSEIMLNIVSSKVYPRERIIDPSPVLVVKNEGRKRVHKSLSRKLPPNAYEKWFKQLKVY